MLVVGVYALVCATMAVNQRHFIYPALLPGIIEPAEAGLTGYTRHVVTLDGAPVTYWQAEGEADAPLLFYFHGNGGGLHTFVPTLDYLRAQGFRVIALEYRGYPGAEGRPSQTGILRDAVALVDSMQQLHPARPMVIWGYSLGSGVASQVAAVRRPAVLVLEAPFTAVVDRARELFPLLPVPWLLSDQYRSREVIGTVGAPLFIMHGEEDHIIPVAHAKALYALAATPKAITLYPEAGHLDLNDYGAYDDATAFIRTHLPAAQSRSGASAE